MQEKRHYSRRSLDVEVSCIRATADGFIGRSKDISLGGMFIFSEIIPYFGDRLTLKLSIPGASAELVLPGVVRWSDRQAGGFGVQFGLLGARETHTIVTFMAQAS